MEIWPFAFLRRGYKERPAFATYETPGPGRRVVQRLAAASTLVVEGAVLFPNAGGDYADFRAWWIARQGAFEAFLFKPQNRGEAAALDESTAATAQVDFDASRRYVDASTLVVKKNGVTQTLTTHYTLTNGSGGAYALGTSPKLTVRFVSAPGNGAEVTLGYEFYAPMRHVGDDLEGIEIHAGGAGAAGTADRVVMVSMRETGPGFSYAAVPDDV